MEVIIRVFQEIASLLFLKRQKYVPVSSEIKRANSINNIIDLSQREELYRVLLRCMHHQVIASDKSTTANLHSYMQKVQSKYEVVILYLLTCLLVVVLGLQRD